MFGILEAVTVPNNGIFNSFEDLMHTLHSRVTKEGYKIVRARSHRGRVGGASIPGNEMVRCDLVCERGGRPYKSTATKHKTSTKKTDCPWKAKAVYRKTIGGWVLTIECDQHNHEPGTPEPPTPPPQPSDDEEDVADAEDDTGPRPDQETSTALQFAGVSNDDLRLTGDTFHRFKNEYRKMPQPERLGVLSQLQLRIAAIYAVQNEEVQRKARQESQRRRHQEIEDAKKDRATQRRARRQQQQQSSQLAAEQSHGQQQQHSQAQPQQLSQPQQPQQPQQQQAQPQTQPQHLQHQTPGQSHLQRQSRQPPPQQASPQAHLAQQNPQLQNHPLAQQQFQLPESSSQQMMAMPGMSMASMTQYSGAQKRMRGARAHQDSGPR